jgi:hypothetical protein
MASDNDVADAPARWRQGEMVDVFEGVVVASNSPRHYHVYVTGIPDLVTFQQVKDALTRMHTTDPDELDYDARRTMVLDFSELNPGQLNNLTRDGEITFTFGAAKTLVRKRVLGELTYGDFLNDADLGL